MIIKKDLENLYNKNGFSLDKIGQKYNLSRAGVQYWITRYNIPRRPRHESGFYGYWGKNSNRPLPKTLTENNIKELYNRKGLSAEDIGKLFNRSSGAVYRFMRRRGLLRRSPSETNNLKFLKQTPTFTVKKQLSLKDNKLKLAGIMLYWAEGYKNLGKNIRGGAVDLANSDPRMIKVFTKFLMEICGVKKERLRVQLYCYANQNINFLKKYWSELTRIPLSQFIKPYVRKDFNIAKIDKMKYGLIHVRYNDKKLFLQMKKWTEDYLKTLKIK